MAGRRDAKPLHEVGAKCTTSYTTENCFACVPWHASFPRKRACHDVDGALCHAVGGVADAGALEHGAAARVRVHVANPHSVNLRWGEARVRDCNPGRRSTNTEHVPRPTQRLLPSCAAVDQTGGQGPRATTVASAASALGVWTHTCLANRVRDTHSPSCWMGHRPTHNTHARAYLVFGKEWLQGLGIRCAGVVGATVCNISVDGPAGRGIGVAAEAHIRT